MELSINMLNGDSPMKRFLILLTVVLMAAVSCHQPEYVAPTAERQGITSLTAYFTFGPYENQELAKLNIDDPAMSRFVIPVPYYYPESSDDETLIYMIKVRVTAELQPNCSIEPGLNILDLTEENRFVYTDAKGEKRDIVITGDRVHSSKAQLLTFDLDDPAISGIVDEAQHKVSLVSADDLSAATATVSLSAHATISPDPSVPHDYNNGFTYTVTAPNGVDKVEYRVVKEVPEKIDYGFNGSSVKQLFNFDPVSILGMPAYTELVYPSLAATGNYLIVNMGDGSDPLYLNKLTGAALGNFALAGAPAAGMTNDDAGNLLFCNFAQGDEDFTIWTSAAINEAPTLYYTFHNTTSLPMGHKIRVIGDIHGDAQIVITLEGIDGVTTSSQFWVLSVSGGSVVAEEVKDASAAALAWGSAPVNCTSICGVSNNPADGWFGCVYDPNVLTWVKGDGTLGSAAGTSDGNNWGWNANCMDSKHFNNATYLTLFVCSHFPAWGIGPRLYLYDISNPGSVKDDFESNSALVMSNTNIPWFQDGSYAVAASDVVLAPSADGFMFYIYYYDHNSQVIGAYSADCIKR